MAHKHWIYFKLALKAGSILSALVIAVPLYAQNMHGTPQPPRVHTAPPPRVNVAPRPPRVYRPPSLPKKASAKKSKKKAVVKKAKRPAKKAIAKKSAKTSKKSKETKSAKRSKAQYKQTIPVGKRDIFRSMQGQLNALGFELGKADGHYGPKTEQAVLAFAAKLSQSRPDLGQKVYSLLTAGNVVDAQPYVTFYISQHQEEVIGKLKVPQEHMQVPPQLAATGGASGGARSGSNGSSAVAMENPASGSAGKAGQGNKVVATQTDAGMQKLSQKAGQADISGQVVTPKVMDGTGQRLSQRETVSMGNGQSLVITATQMDGNATKLTQKAGVPYNQMGQQNVGNTLMPGGNNMGGTPMPGLNPGQIEQTPTVSHERQTPQPPVGNLTPTTGQPIMAPELPNQPATKPQALERLAVAGGGGGSSGGSQSRGGNYGSLRDLDYYQDKVRINPPPFQLPPNLGSSRAELDAALTKLMADANIPFDPASYDALGGVDGLAGEGGDDPVLAYWYKDLDGKLSSYNSSLAHLEWRITTEYPNAKESAQRSIAERQANLLADITKAEQIYQQDLARSHEALKMAYEHAMYEIKQTEGSIAWYEGHLKSIKSGTALAHRYERWRDNHKERIPKIIANYEKYVQRVQSREVGFDAYKAQLHLIDENSRQMVRDAKADLEHLARLKSNIADGLNELKYQKQDVTALAQKVAGMKRDAGDVPDANAEDDLLSKLKEELDVANADLEDMKKDVKDLEDDERQKRKDRKPSPDPDPKSPPDPDEPDPDLVDRDDRLPDPKDSADYVDGDDYADREDRRAELKNQIDVTQQQLDGDMASIKQYEAEIRSVHGRTDISSEEKQRIINDLASRIEGKKFTIDLAKKSLADMGAEFDGYDGRSFDEYDPYKVTAAQKDINQNLTDLADFEREYDRAKKIIDMSDDTLDKYHLKDRVNDLVDRAMDANENIGNLAQKVRTYADGIYETREQADINKLRNEAILAELDAQAYLEGAYNIRNGSALSLALLAGGTGVTAVGSGLAGSASAGAWAATAAQAGAVSAGYNITGGAVDGYNSIDAKTGQKAGLDGALKGAGEQAAREFLPVNTYLLINDKDIANKGYGDLGLAVLADTFNIIGLKNMADTNLTSATKVKANIADMDMPKQNRAITAAARSARTKGLAKIEAYNDALKRVDDAKVRGVYDLEADKALNKALVGIENSDEAKLLLKKASSGAQDRFNRLQKNRIRDPQKAVFEQRMKERGWSESGTKLKSVRNQSSRGTVGMDDDLAIAAEPTRIDRNPDSSFKYGGPDGEAKFKADTKAFRDNLTKNGRKASLMEYQRDAEWALNQASIEVTGQAAPRSRLEATSSVATEAFADIKLLDGDAGLTGRSLGWAEQSASVSHYKAQKAIQYSDQLGLNQTGSAGTMPKGDMLEVAVTEIKVGAREVVKDVAGKAWKLRPDTEVPQKIRRQVGILNKLANGEFDPAQANYWLKQETGTSLSKTLDSLPGHMEAYIKQLPASALAKPSGADLGSIVTMGKAITRQTTSSNRQDQPRR